MLRCLIHEDGSTALGSVAHRGCRYRCRGPRDFVFMGLFLRCRSRVVLVLIYIDVEVSYPRGFCTARFGLPCQVVENILVTVCEYEFGTVCRSGVVIGALHSLLQDLVENSFVCHTFEPRQGGSFQSPPRAGT